VHLRDNVAVAKRPDGTLGFQPDFIEAAAVADIIMKNIFDIL